MREDLHTLREFCASLCPCGAVASGRLTDSPVGRHELRLAYNGECIAVELIVSLYIDLFHEENGTVTDVDNRAECQGANKSASGAIREATYTMSSEARIKPGSC